MPEYRFPLQAVTDHDEKPLLIGTEYRSGRTARGVDVNATSAEIRRYDRWLVLGVRGTIDAENGGCSITLPGEGYLHLSIAQARSLRDALSAALEAQP